MCNGGPRSHPGLGILGPVRGGIGWARPVGGSRGTGTAPGRRDLTGEGAWSYRGGRGGAVGAQSGRAQRRQQPRLRNRDRDRDVSRDGGGGESGAEPCAERRGRRGRAGECRCWSRAARSVCRSLPRASRPCLGPAPCRPRPGPARCGGSWVPRGEVMPGCPGGARCTPGEVIPAGGLAGAVRDLPPPALPARAQGSKGMGQPGHGAIGSRALRTMGSPHPAWSPRLVTATQAVGHGSLGWDTEGTSAPTGIPRAGRSQCCITGADGKAMATWSLCVVVHRDAVGLGGCGMLGPPGGV